MNTFACQWIDQITSASWQGGIAVGLVWLLCQRMPRIPSEVRSWLWRLVYVKLLFTFLGFAPIRLPLLPAPREVTFVPAHGIDSSDHIAAPYNKSVSRVQFRTLREDGFLLLCGFWLTGVIFYGVRTAREWREMVALRDGWLPESDPKLTACYSELCQLFDVAAPPLLLRSQGTGSPLLFCGWGASAIILPSELCVGCSVEELRLMLAHELAHFKRNDLKWCWLPTISHCLFFFHPLIWLAHRQWHLAQEMACDELALRVTQAGAGDYGAVLLKVAAQNDLTQHLTLAVVSREEFPQSLAQRLSALLTSSQRSRLSPLRLSLVITMIVAAGLIPWQVVAQRPPQMPAGIAALSGISTVGERMHWLGRALDLSRDQQAQLQLLVLTSSRRGIPSLSKSNNADKMLPTPEAAEVDFQAALTPDQRRTLERLGGNKVLAFALHPSKAAETSPGGKPTK